MIYVRTPLRDVELGTVDVESGTVTGVSGCHPVRVSLT